MRGKKRFGLGRGSWSRARCRERRVKSSRNRPIGVERQASLALARNTARGFRSVPMPVAPEWAHSTSVVPLPQKGSRTRLSRPTPKMFNIALATCGLNLPLYSWSPWTE